MISPRRRFWIAWVGLYAIGHFVDILLAADLESLLAAALSFLLLPTAQWLVLRSRLSWSLGWVPATLAGVFLGVALGVAAGYFQAALATQVLLASVAGTLAGGGQWIILRHDFESVGWWIPVSAVSFAVEEYLPGLTGAILAGAITGSVLLGFLFREPAGESKPNYRAA